MTGRDDVMAMAAQVMRKSVIAHDMRTLGRAVGEFYTELLASLREGGMDEEMATTDAFSLTSTMLSEFISAGLHMESHDGGDEEDDDDGS